MISPQAHIHPDAKIGKNAKIGPFCYIEGDVIIGDDCEILPFASVMDKSRIGDRCRIFQGAVIGSIPQDLKFHGEDSIVEIGNDVTIREYVTINRGTEANYTTSIGDYSLLMAYVHIAHDCIIGAHCILANDVNIAGHVTIGDYVILGGLSAVQQFVRIGEHSFIGGASLVRKDVPPFVKAAREPLSYAGVNTVGLKRRGFTNVQIHNIQEIYRLLYVRGYKIKEAIQRIQMELPDTEEQKQVLEFIESSQQGIMRGFQAS